jgi:hypothetical protein
LSACEISFLFTYLTFEQYIVPDNSKTGIVRQVKESIAESVKKMAVCLGETHSQRTKMRNLDFLLRRGSTLLTTGCSGQVTSPIPGAERCFVFRDEAYSTPAAPYFLRLVRDSVLFGSGDPSRAFARGRFAAA